MFKLVLFVLLYMSVGNGDSEVPDSEDETLLALLDLELSDLTRIQNETKIIQTLIKIPYFRDNVTQECQRDILDILNGTMEAKPWALTMLDSMEKFPSGIIWGKRVIIGQFFECISVESENFKGKHCMVEIVDKKNKSLSWPSNAFERLRDNHFSYGVCVPSTCSANDIKNFLKAIGLQKMVSFDISDKSCTTEKMPELRPEDWATIWVLCIAVFLSLASTFYEVYCSYKEKDEMSSSFLASFSLYSNGKRLFGLSDNYAELKVLNGIRYISITWVVLGHLYSEIYHAHLANFYDASSIINEKLAIVGTNGYLSVDTFFFLGGLLACFVFFKEISKKGSYDAPLGIIQRYLRLTPSLGVIILIQATIFSRLGDGPVWRKDVEDIEEVCRKTWWTYLLYIDNYIYESRKCLGQAWYLCADMQMFLVSPIIFYLIYLLPKFAPLILFLLTVATSMISFIISYIYKLPPSLSFTAQINGQRLEMEAKEYRQFHTRMAPYVIGIATGYLLCGIRAKKIKIELPKKWIILGWGIASGLCLGSLYGVIAFMPFGSYNSSSSEISFYGAFYRAFHRTGWALGLSWILTACVVGYGGPVNYFLSLNIFQPLAKLSYGVFLIHKFVQRYRVSNIKITSYYTKEDMVYSMIVDVVLSTALAIPFTLLFEMPLGNITKLMFQNSKILPLPKKKKIIDEEKDVKESK